MSQDTSANPSLHPTSLKRRMYIVGSALGVALCVLYAFSIFQEGATAALVLSIGLTIEIFIFLALFVFAPQWIDTLEVAFYFVMVASLMLLGVGQIYLLYARQELTPDKLGFLINTLVLWLTIYQLGAFLVLPFQRLRQLLRVIWVIMALIVASAALVMRPPEEWRYSYLISWVAGLAALWIVSLMINWLGRRQRLQATTDALTGIANRHMLSDLLARHYDRAAAQQRSFAVMLIDIDNFKSINDSLGHAVGDHVLIDVAATIMQYIRGGDYVGRWGGDEFLALLVDTDLSAAQQIAERIRATLEQHAFPGAAQATVSIGAHAYQAGQSIEEVLSCADQALYQAKLAGRNQVSVWAHL